MADESEIDIESYCEVEEQRLNQCPVLVGVFLLTLLVPSEISLSLGTLVIPPYRFFLAITLPISICYVLVIRYKESTLADYCVLLCGIWIFATYLYHIGLTDSIEPSGCWFIETAGPYFLSRFAFRTSNEVSAAISLVSICCAVLGVIAIIGSIAHKDPVDSFVRPAMGLPILEYGDRLGMSRMSLMFFHPIHWGVIAASLFSFALLHVRGVGLKGFVTLGTFLGALSSLSSGALASLSMQVMLVCWNYLFLNNRRRWVNLALMLVLVYILIDLISERDPMSVAFTYLTFSSHTAYWRSIIFEYGVAEVIRNPLLGIGLSEWTRPSYMRSGSMDNFWLVLAVRHGIPAFLLLCIAYLIVIVRSFRHTIFSPKDTLVTAYAFSMAATGTAAVSVHFWLAILSYFLFLMGMCPAVLRGLAYESEHPGDA